MTRVPVTSTVPGRRSSSRTGVRLAASYFRVMPVMYCSRRKPSTSTFSWPRVRSINTLPGRCGAAFGLAIVLPRDHIARQRYLMLARAVVRIGALLVHGLGLGPPVHHHGHGQDLRALLALGAY